MLSNRAIRNRGPALLQRSYRRISAIELIWDNIHMCSHHQLRSLFEYGFSISKGYRFVKLNEWYIVSRCLKVNTYLVINIPQVKSVY